VSRAFSKTLHRVCGHLQGAFRVRTADGEVTIDRAHPLPLIALAHAAESDGAFALDPRYSTGDRSAHLGLWTYAPAYQAALDKLPNELRPQLAVRTPAGTAMIWVPRTPYIGSPDADASAADLLGVIADALGTVPPGSDDGIPLPRADEDLLILSDATQADPAALWSWAEQIVNGRQRAISEVDVGEPAAREFAPDAGAEPLANGTDDGDVEASTAASLSTRPSALSAQLTRLLEGLASRTNVCSDVALARALVAHAMATLGTIEVYKLLGVGLTWSKADGLYGWADNCWRRIA
jgi:hypothetical protein